MKRRNELSRKTRPRQVKARNVAHDELNEVETPESRDEPKSWARQFASRVAGLFAGRSHWIGRVVLCWLVLALFPRMPYHMGTGIDASWYYGINIAHQKQLVYGKDLVYTVGPLGYLTVPVPGYAEKWVVCAFLLTTYLLSLYGLYRCFRILGLWRTIVVGLVVLVITLYSLHYPDKWLAGVVPLLVAIAASASFPKLDLILAGVWAGLTMLIKVNDGVGGIAVVTIFAVVAYYRYRAAEPRVLQWTLLSIAVPVAILQLGMWTLNHDFFSTIAYVKGSLVVGGGYSEAMSVRGPVWQSGLALLTLCGIVGSSLFALFGQEKARVLSGVLPAALLGFLSFKHGIVRQDGHADLVQAKLAISALLVMAICSRVRNQLGYVTVAVGCCVVGVVVTSRAQPQRGAEAASCLRLGELLPRADQFLHFSRAWSEFDAAARNELRPLILPASFHSAIGSATLDVFPNEIDRIEANGWADNFSPRPALQSFVAYTPALDGLNAAHLAGPQAPQFALWSHTPMDGRHPFVEDVASWRVLLDRYAVRLEDQNMLLLERRASPRFAEPKYISTEEAGLGELIRVPRVGPKELAVASVEAEQSFYGVLKTFLFRGTDFWIHVHYASGREQRLRALRPNLRAGVVVSPFPLTFPEFVSLFRGGDCPDPVVTVQWGAGEPLEMKNRLKVTWYRWTPRDGAERASATGGARDQAPAIRPEAGLVATSEN